jgi:hypothetical protein
MLAGASIHSKPLTSSRQRRQGHVRDEVRIQAPNAGLAGSFAVHRRVLPQGLALVGPWAYALWCTAP